MRQTRIGSSCSPEPWARGYPMKRVRLLAALLAGVCLIAFAQPSHAWGTTDSPGHPIDGYGDPGPISGDPDSPGTGSPQKLITSMWHLLIEKLLSTTTVTRSQVRSPAPAHQFDLKGLQK